MDDVIEDTNDVLIEDTNEHIPASTDHTERDTGAENLDLEVEVNGLRELVMAFPVKLSAVSHAANVKAERINSCKDISDSLK